METFAIDIDGCITNGKGHFTSPSALMPITEFNQQKGTAAFLCTGRSAPYVEAISQILHINQWCICENGAYLYHPMKDEMVYNHLIKDDTLVALDDSKQLLRDKKIKPYYKQELGKEICISLNPTKSTIEELFELISDKIDHSLLYINHSTTAVDITPMNVDKGSALIQLSQQENVLLDNVVAVGDSSGDIPFMQLSGHKACPANASESVKQLSDYISPLPTSHGVVDILKHFSA